MNGNDTPISKSLLINLYDLDGQVRSTLDFAKLGIDESLASALRNGFFAEYAHTTAKSQRATWTHLRNFCKFVRSSESGCAMPLKPTILSEFRGWLASSNLSASSATVCLRVASTLLTYCERNAPHVLSNRTKLNVEGFGIGFVNHREAISEDAIKKILNCCHADIEKIERRLALGRRLRVGKCLNQDEMRKSHLIQELLNWGGGRLPPQEDIFGLKQNLKRRVLAEGGLREICRQIWLCTEDIIPFYIAMLIQTSGNATSIKDLTRDCVKSHPIRGDLERIVWQKHRAHREQWLDMPVGRQWSAAGIVRRLRALNHELIPSCQSRDSDKLFVAYRLDRCSPGTPSESRLHVLGGEFKDRHDLPCFTFSSIRRAGANAHAGAAKSIKAAQARLNHASVTTTSRYIETQTLASIHDQLINHYQGVLFEASFNETPADVTDGGDGCATHAMASAETVFGFGCKDPFSGLAAGSRKGSMCLQFQKCATCPGAIVPVNDVTIIARLLGAKDALQEAKDRALKEGWSARFEKFYEPTRLILVNEILPMVSDTVLELASADGNRHRIPRLE